MIRCDDYIANQNSEPTAHTMSKRTLRQQEQAAKVAAHVAGLMFSFFQAEMPLIIRHTSEKHLSTVHLWLLCLLYEVPSKATLHMGEIAARLGYTKPSITGMVDVLEAHGFVIREFSPDDRRKVFISITEEGKKLVNGLHERMLNFVSTKAKTIPAPMRKKLAAAS